MGRLKIIPLDGIRSRGSIRDQDVMKLRGAYYSDGIIGPDEAETLFALNNACPIQDPAWCDFFIEAVTDYVVNMQQPEGYLTGANAQWLMMRVARDGRIRTRTELGLVLNSLSKARWSPVSLVGFALEQARDAVLFGDGPLRDAARAPAGVVLEEEVEYIRRALYAFGGDGNVPITRTEAEVLFEINSAVAAAKLNATWIEMFAKVLVNLIMSASGYSVPSREEALRPDANLERRQECDGAGATRALTAVSVSSVLRAYREQSTQDRALARLERQRIEIITSEEVTEGDATWLSERLTRQDLSPVELAVLGYLRRHGCCLHPLLVDAVERSSRAA